MSSAVNEIKESFVCANCDHELVPLRRPQLYCSAACQQEAELIRYVRRCIADGRIDQEDVQLAIQTRFAHVASGGYDRKARFISKAARVEAIARTSGACAICGDDGDEIDHIDGDSDDQKNLQLLCKICHHKKTFERIHTVVPGGDSYEAVKALHVRLWSSIEVAEPLRPCHDGVNWASRWRDELKQREFFVLIG